jgi:hypothetical protein
MNRKKKGTSGPMSPALGQKPDPRYLYVCEGMTLDEIVEKCKGIRGYSKRSLARRSSAEMWKGTAAATPVFERLGDVRSRATTCAR